MLILSFLKAIGGFALLFVGGEMLLRGAVALAQRFGMSHLLIGLTVVAAATSMPELVVAVASGIEGVPDIGVGNVIGSNIANILLILGVAALIYPVRTRPRHVLRDGLALVAATAIMTAFALAGPLAWPQGIVLLALLVSYLGFCCLHEQRLNRPADPDPDPDPATAEVAEVAEVVDDPALAYPLALCLVALGVGSLVLGSKLLVDGAVEIARAAGISEAVIGLSLVAVGTSLPELATAVVAGIRRHSEVALGNVLGSNLFNTLGIMAALAFTTRFTVAPEMLRLDIWMMAGVTVLILPVMLSGWRVGRREGALFLVLYAGYVVMLFGRQPLPAG